MLILTELDSAGHPVVDHGVIVSLSTFNDTEENRLLMLKRMRNLASENLGTDYAIITMVPKILFRTGEPVHPCGGQE